MSPDDEVAVSFAAVAAEDAEESVAHEAEATEAIDASDPDAVDPDGPLEDNTAPDGAATTSMTGFGPVTGGDGLAI